MTGNRTINLLSLAALMVGVLTVAAWVLGSILTGIQAANAVVRGLTTRTVRGAAGPAAVARATGAAHVRLAGNPRPRAVATDHPRRTPMSEIGWSKDAIGRGDVYLASYEARCGHRTVIDGDGGRAGVAVIAREA